MNKTAIKNFSIWARNKLIADISYRAGLLGITPAGIRSPLPQSTGTTQFFDIGSADPYVISGEQIKQRARLAEALRSREQRSDYATAYKYLMEEVAYTWFNRLAAIRFMEVNDYLPGHIRVLSSESGKIEPDLCTTPFEAGLDFTSDEERLIVSLKNENRLDDLFRLLFVKQCNALNSVLPSLFERTDDYTELLLNLPVIDQDGVVWHLVHDIPEDDFNVEKGGQVEIIGWLYQYYNTEPKSAVFAKAGKITKEEIPAVTQLFTPDWIVRYMVENSLGRLWVEGHPNDELKTEWKYYLEEAEQEPEVLEQLRRIRSEYAKLNPEDIRLIDPCMGSGHILVYAFDVLMQIYESAGYARRDAVRSILENNLFGLDIDKRAYQLAYFALMMKARQYDKRFLSRGIAPHVFAIEESNSVNRAQLRYFGTRLDELSRNNAENQLQDLLDTFVDAKEYGSILKVPEMDWNLLREYVADYDVGDQISLDVMDIETTQAKLKVLIDQGEIMARKYSVAVTNPPYMGISSGSGKLNDFVKKNYPDSKADLFAVFIEQCIRMTEQYGFTAMITMHAWMFLSNFYKLREKLLRQNMINMVHLGARAFDEIGGEVVQTVTFVLRKEFVNHIVGKYCRAVNALSEADKRKLFLEEEHWYVIKQENLESIPNKTWAYWIGRHLADSFYKNPSIGKMYRTMAGSSTGDNNRFLRLWYEVSIDKIGFNLPEGYSGFGYKWIPCLKGGSFRKWYGNQSYIVNWENDGAEIKYWVTHNPQDPNTTSWSRRLFNTDMFYHPGVTWSKITTGKFSARYMNKGFIMESASCAIMPNHSDELGMLSLLNSIIAQNVIDILNPTINVQVGDVMAIPVNSALLCSEEIKIITDNSIKISRSDWDSFETSWDFKRHPLLPPREEV